MVQTKEECIEKGGIGKFSQEICYYCNEIRDCKLAEKDRKIYLEEERRKQELKTKLARKRLGGRKVRDEDLVCQYCGRSPKNCPCKNKPEARFILRTGQLSKGWDKKKL